MNEDFFSRRDMLKLSALLTATGAAPFLQAYDARAQEANAPVRVGYLPITDATPLLVAMGNDLYHPQATSRRIAELAPDVLFVEAWKDGEALAAFDGIARRFLERHTP